MADSKPGIMRADDDCRNVLLAAPAKSNMAFSFPTTPLKFAAMAAMDAAAAGFQKAGAGCGGGGGIKDCGGAGREY